HLSHQWFFNGNPLLRGTNATLELIGITRANSGNYQVVVSNSVASVTSALAVISLHVHLSGPWVRKAGGNGIATDAIGNSYVTGGADPANPTLLAKYDSEGNLLWSRGSA